MNSLHAMNLKITKFFWFYYWLCHWTQFIVVAHFSYAFFFSLFSSVSVSKLFTYWHRFKCFDIYSDSYFLFANCKIIDIENSGNFRLVLQIEGWRSFFFLVDLWLSCLDEKITFLRHTTELKYFLVKIVYEKKYRYSIFLADHKGFSLNNKHFSFLIYSGSIIFLSIKKSLIASYSRIHAKSWVLFYYQISNGMVKIRKHFMHLQLFIN